MLQASPKKLKSGDWGALVKSESVRPGDSITITTKAGKSWSATVDRVLWSGKGIAICATQGKSNTRSSRGRWTGCSCGSREDEYGDLIPSSNNCAQCEFDA